MSTTLTPDVLPLTPQTPQSDSQSPLQLRQLSTQLSNAYDATVSATNQMYSSTKNQMYSSTNSFIKTILDPSVLETLSSTTFSSATTSPQKTLTTQTQTMYSFISSIIAILFNHTTYVKNETNRFLQLHKFNDKKIIFPLDRRTFRYLKELQHIRSKAILAVASPVPKSVPKSDHRVSPLHKQPSTSQSTQLTPSTPSPPSSSPSSPSSPSLHQSQELPLAVSPLPQQLPSLPILSFQPNLVPFSSFSSFTLLTPTLRSDGKAQGDLLSFIAHTVERVKETATLKTDLTVQSKSLSTLDDSFRALNTHIHSICDFTQKQNAQRDNTREERIATVKSARILVDKEYKEKATIAMTEHKQRLAHLDSIKQQPIQLPSVANISLTEPLALQQQRALSHFAHSSSSQQSNVAPLSAIQTPTFFAQPGSLSFSSSALTTPLFTTDFTLHADTHDNSSLLSTTSITATTSLPSLSRPTTATGTAPTTPADAFLSLGDMTPDESIYDSMIADMLSPQPPSTDSQPSLPFSTSPTLFEEEKSTTKPKNKKSSTKASKKNAQ